jgi:cytochrome c peroxidase
MRIATVAAAGLVAAGFLAAAVARGGAEETKPSYVGDGKCMKCHSKQVMSWKKTPLRKSLEALKPTTEADDKDLFEKKKKAGLDPAKDYTGDAACLKCHTTGYGREGGYPEKVTEESKKAAESLGSVSCEACHGPGSAYVEYKNARRKENKDATFTKEEMLKLGLVEPTEANCRTCHNKDNPTNAMDDFKFEEAKAKVHDHTR